VLGGRSVYEVRKAIGMQLALENPADADLVIPVPDSGVPAALGYAQQSGIPFELGIIRSHYVGRTFIQPSDGARNADVKRKHNANRALVAGKRIVLIDDRSRGTTSLKIVQMMREAGAREVHFRVASPPTEHSCFYGVDTPERSKLLAARWTLPPWPNSSRPTAWRSSRSTASIAPWAKRSAAAPARSIATPASPVTIPRA
jgi:amidophosphoribosyltransferase